ncbi:penicillin-binding transpeptidase domain-containing protein [Isachenkonia alkalipeptolytica]|uniref:PASTA domain-containing protein n=1 Tax=Isachenkonia alkalipeptolytica TaxID=2565777 RepID=A0AA44BET5_9CLOT|nr:penicillin-binding transpeptidase domain-containing protein [Isachenkonia alkalipeptolytica]NBG88515.1 PASTA domain-containing protein [Isachenkonia alkalipeptolytica]
MTRNQNQKPGKSTKTRLVLVFLTLSLCIFALVLRLGWLQVIRGEEFQQMARRQQTSDITLTPSRGTIYDRNGKELVLSASTHAVYASPDEIGNKEETAKVLAKLLEVDAKDLLERMENETSQVITIKRWVDRSTGKEIEDKGLRGIWITDDHKRYYPYGNFASYVLGHTDADNEGVAGIELRYDKHLSGVPGRWIRTVDRDGRQLSSSSEVYHPSEEGLGIVLTIDEVIQHITEKALDNAMEIHNPERAMAVVMNVKSGEILAMAAKPDYDPNNPREPLDLKEKEALALMDSQERLEYWFSMWRNPVINDSYEPGSTFKAITAAAALEEGTASLDSEYYSDGYIDVGGPPIRSWRYYDPFGHQTFSEAYRNSDNPVFVEMLQDLGGEAFYEYIEGFGFFDLTGVDLPGESRSIIPSLEEVRPEGPENFTRDLATMSFGQSFNTTPLQILTAYSAAVNNGELMEPQIVKELLDAEGNPVEKVEHRMVRQVVSEETSRDIRRISEEAMRLGNSQAYVPGYAVGGKTGTAQKLVDGHYPSGVVIGSFVGAAPMDDPEIAVITIVDEPRGGTLYGNTTAAPIAGEIFSETFRYLGIEPRYTEEELEKIEDEEKIEVPNVLNKTLKEAREILGHDNLEYLVVNEFLVNEEALVVETGPKPGVKVEKNSTISIYIEQGDQEEELLMPDLEGMTVSEVKRILKAMGLQLKVQGEGRVVNQDTAPGTIVEKEKVIVVEFQ